jgi:hypothetical protein
VAFTKGEGSSHAEIGHMMHCFDTSQFPSGEIGLEN